jgi:uncharacterized protein (DUF1697 family)
LTRTARVQSSLSIALLRGINVGGHNMVAMANLCALFEKVGFSEVKSLLQSGNLVFRGDRRPAADVERLLEAESARRLALNAHYFVRSAAEWSRLIAENPFSEEAERDPGRLVLMCLKDAPSSKSLRALKAAVVGRETFRANGKHLYIVFPDGMGTSRFTNVLIERHLATSGTARNWNTVLKLNRLATPL